MKGSENMEPNITEYESILEFAFVFCEQYVHTFFSLGQVAKIFKLTFFLFVCIFLT